MAWTSVITDAGTTPPGGYWIADLGPLDYLPGPPTAAVMPPASDCAELDYLVSDQSFAAITGGMWSDVLAASYLAFRYYGGGGASIAEVKDTPVPPEPWHCYAIYWQPNYELTGTAPTLDPAALTPPPALIRVRLDLGGLDLALTVGPRDRTGTARLLFGALAVAATATDRPTLALYAEDGRTWLAALPLAAGIAWQEEISAPGSLSFRLPTTDPALPEVLPRRIVKVAWRGRVRQAARLDNLAADEAVDGVAWRSWQNLPGPLALLGRVPVYPEYGLERSSQAQRWFGYMSRRDAWYQPPDWTPALGVKWSQMTGVRTGLPEGLAYPDPEWITKRGPNVGEPAGTVQYLRREFTTSATLTTQLLATADNELTLWLDGERIIEPDAQQGQTWRYLVQLSLTLPAGPHVLAAKISNTPLRFGYLHNPMGLLLTLQQTDASGDVLEGVPLVNSDPRWRAADVAGFRKADVLVKLWTEGTVYGYRAMQILTRGFDHTHDSAGQPWTDPPGEYGLDVGSTVLDACTQLAESGLDVLVEPDTLTLQAWSRKGADRGATVALALGVDGGSVLAHQRTETEARYNTALAQLANGTWVQRQDAAAVAAVGREGAGISAGSSSDLDTVAEVLDGQLAEAGQTLVAFTTQLSSLIGPQPYRDFDLGDTITVPGGDRARVLALTFDAAEDGPVRITPELVADNSDADSDLEPGGPGTGDPGA